MASKPLNRKELRLLSRERLKDAKALRTQRRYHGAIYMAGYAVEIALKERICKTLQWKDFASFPSSPNLKIHNLDTLLIFSGVERHVKSRYLVEWSIVQSWNPEQRYEIPASPPTDSMAGEMIAATTTLIGYLCTYT